MKKSFYQHYLGFQ